MSWGQLDGNRLAVSLIQNDWFDRKGRLFLVMKKKRQTGFTMTELVVVCSILLAVASLAVMAGQVVVNSFRLSAAGSSVASLILQARIQAVRSNSPSYAILSNSATPNMVFVASDPSTSYSLGMPDVEINPTFALQPATLPNHDQLDNYLGITGAKGSPSLQTVNYVGFNARGLPCVEGAAGAVQCVQQDSNGAIPEFEWFIKGSGSSWEAVTVTAAGRAKAWRLSDSSSKASSHCGFSACWQ